MTLFVDTSAFYAAADETDRNNARAIAVLGAGEGLVTTDHVLVETWLLMRRHIGPEPARSLWSSLRSGAAEIELVGSADLEAAWAIGDAFPDQDFPIVDRTSFAVMERVGLSRVATFDMHFAVYRYGRDRRRAFEIVA